MKKNNIYNTEYINSVGNGWNIAQKGCILLIVCIYVFFIWNYLYYHLIKIINEMSQSTAKNLRDLLIKQQLNSKIKFKGEPVNKIQPTRK